jgi:cytochrome b involved in lipid metabolism
MHTIINRKEDIILQHILLKILTLVLLMNISTSSSSRKFSDRQEMEDYASANAKTLVTLGDYVVDATSFAKHHPGGHNIV